MAVALWNVEWLVKRNGGVRSVPAFDFLLDQPPAVRIQLLREFSREIAPPPSSGG
jgi:hypothetical protein